MLKGLYERIHVFWLEHKIEILFWGGAAIGCAGIVIASNHIAEKNEEKRAAAEKEAEEARQKEKEEYELEEARIMNDPANQIPSGGYIRPDNDWLSDGDYPGALINTVPVSSMGEFGQNILNRLNEEYFGEFKDENGFKLETATADVMIDFGHEVWRSHNS